MKKRSGAPVQPGHVGSSDNSSTRYWPPGSLHTLEAGSYIKERGWLFMWIKILCLKQIYQLMNYYELPNIQACSFLMFGIRGCTQSLVASCKYWVVSLISTRVSGYSQAILLVCPQIVPELPRWIQRTQKYIFSFSSIFQHGDDRCCWNLPRGGEVHVYHKCTFPIPFDHE